MTPPNQTKLNMKWDSYNPWLILSDVLTVLYALDHKSGKCLELTRLEFLMRKFLLWRDNVSCELDPECPPVTVFKIGGAQRPDANKFGSNRSPVPWRAASFISPCATWVPSWCYLIFHLSLSLSHLSATCGWLCIMIMCVFGANTSEVSWFRRICSPTWQLITIYVGHTKFCAEDIKRAVSNAFYKWWQSIQIQVNFDEMNFDEGSWHSFHTMSNSNFSVWASFLLMHWLIDTVMPPDFDNRENKSSK